MKRWVRHWELKVMAVLLALFLWLALRWNPPPVSPRWGPPRGEDAR